MNVAGDFTFDEAFWLAIARSYTDDPGLAARLARTKIARTPRGELAFWREVTRFFCGHPASKEEIDDLCDYIGAMHQRDAAYSLKGRTLASLRRQMLEWHRDIAAIERIEAYAAAPPGGLHVLPDLSRRAAPGTARVSRTGSGSRRPRRRRRMASASSFAS
ncbi:hypothetical protein AJ88_17155 [Mesorhizobium amorphae CCBAU 01583]|nr:hypothetical protein AJ88_17155 [Mesorhizobium amorphae CCBAU 01583]